MLGVEASSTMGRARCQTLSTHSLLFMGLVLAGCYTSAEQFLYSNQHQDGFHIPFDNVSMMNLTSATGITDNGTALCLTQPIATVNPDAAGGSLVKTPVVVLDPETKKVLSFETMFSFYIQSPPAGSGYLNGHGLAFVLFPDTSSRGAPGMYLGWLNESTNGNTTNHFAVEFDTVQNEELGDIDSNHVGVNINNLSSICSTKAGYWDDGAKFKELNLATEEEKWVYAWIEYDGTGINVTISDRKAKPVKALLTCPLDLSKYIMQDVMYVGFTSSTGKDSHGSHVSQHSVYEWSFGIGNLSAINLFGNETIPSLSGIKRKSPIPFAVIITAAVAVPLVVVVALIVGLLNCRKHRQLQNARDFKVAELETLNAAQGPQKFSYRELSRATKSFSASTQLGKGGFGSVHKGTLPNRQEVLAVKRISKDSKQGTQEFVAEVNVIGRARHRNLVPLLGWCHDTRRGELLLVHQFMPNGSLDQLLFSNHREVLGWAKRFNILCGVGSALVFLHEEWEQRVIHRDVKASNVMLDAEFNARLGDFGLARSYDHNQDGASTYIAGTNGYIAPELFKELFKGPRSRPTEKTDVYSFGVLTLEIATGRKATQFEDPESLVQHVLDLFRENRLLEAADARLSGQFSPGEMSVVLQVGLLCANPNADARPTMRKSLAMLKEESPLIPVPLTEPLPELGSRLRLDSGTTATELVAVQYVPDSRS